MRVATEGDTVVVAAAGEDSNGSSPADNSARNAGAAYVFGRANGIWTQQAYLKSANIQCDDSFGHSVAIAGDTVVVGAPGEDSDGTSPANNSVESAGAAYVFGRTNGIWTQQAYLKAANPGEDDSFGYAVAIADDTVVVGAWMEDGNGSSPGDNSAPDAGAAYAFRRTNGIWIQQGYLKANSADAQDIFGESVAIVGNTVVVSAPWEDGPGSGPVTNGRDSGAAYIFDLTSLTSIQQEKYPLFLPFLRR